MSYDIRIVDKETKMPIMLENKHDIIGGTYAVGGTRELWLNITYNYAPFFRKVFSTHGTDGIHCIECESVDKTIPWIEEAINNLGDDVDDNYWSPTEGNAKKSLKSLLELAKLCPYGEWEIT